METKTEVRTLSANYICDSCNDGCMEPTGVVLPSYPPQYPHKCSNCGFEQTFRCMYPYIVHEQNKEREGK